MLKERCNATTIYQRLVVVHDDCVPHYCTRWFNKFKRVHQSLEDDPWSGRPLDAVNPISVAAVEKLILANQKVKVSEIVKELQTAAGALKT